MRCPYCAGENTQVKDSRPTEENAAIRRRRICPDCGGRFTTFERVQLRELVVVKRSGRKVPFERDKLVRSVELALRKRPDRPRARRAHGVGPRAPARKLGRERGRLIDHRRARHGGAARARSRRLRALRLGLSRLPRGGRLPGGAERDRRPRRSRRTRRCSRSRAPTRRRCLTRSTEVACVPAASAGFDAHMMAIALRLAERGLGAHGAEPVGRRGRRRRERRRGDRARLDRARRASACRDHRA